MVTVKLINSTDFPKAFAMVGMAGKYIVPVRGLENDMLDWVARYIGYAHDAPKQSSKGGHNNHIPFFSCSVDRKWFLGLSVFVCVTRAQPVIVGW